MTKLEDIEKAVEQFHPTELAQFRAWFVEFDGAQFDDKIQRDAASGKLDRLAEQALSDFQAQREQWL